MSASLSSSTQQYSTFFTLPLFAHSSTPFTYVSFDNDRFVLRASKKLKKKDCIAFVGGEQTTNISSSIPSPYIVHQKYSTTPNKPPSYIDASIFANCYTKDATPSFTLETQFGIMQYINKHCPLALFALPSSPTQPPNTEFKSIQGIIHLVVKDRSIKVNVETNKKGVKIIFKRINIQKDEIIVADYSTLFEFLSPSSFLIPTSSTSSLNSSVTQNETTSLDDLVINK